MISTASIHLMVSSLTQNEEEPNERKDCDRNLNQQQCQHIVKALSKYISVFIALIRLCAHK